jgi:phosphoribosylformylglycinamidine cyclo-ligase
VSSQYAQAGVDPKKIEPFKWAMIEMGRTTLAFPNKRDVFVEVSNHGATYEYRGPHEHMWSNTQEGLGNKNWIAEWMYGNGGNLARTHYESIGIDAAMMAVNDVIAQGAMPVVYRDEVAAGDSEWFTDEKRAKDLARGFYRACELAGMALPAGESPSLKYLVKAAPPVKSAPSLSGCVTGIIAPKSRLLKGSIAIGDHIIGVASSGVHANGISLIIKKAMALPNRFYTEVPGGRTLGEEVLTPTRCYVNLVEWLLQDEVEIHALLPGTGGGIAKVAFDKRSFTYRLHTWPKNIAPIFPFIREVLEVPLVDCLTTFNWGIGYYLFVPAKSVERTMHVGNMLCDLEMYDLGIVEEGERKVIFEPENIVLPPPGE